METGEQPTLSGSERRDIERIVEVAHEICGYEFAVYLGFLDNGRESAVAVHAGLHRPESAVLVAIDAAARSMDIVTGERVRRTLTDRACEFALLKIGRAHV